MYTRNNTFRRVVKIALKAALLVGVYFLFSTYSLPAYYSVKAFVEERFMADSRVIILGESAVTIEVVDTDEGRIKGLSGRETLQSGNGMFFVFDEVGLHGIWMKDMNFPIDILWFDQYGSLIHIEEHVTPESYPETFYPISPSKYVLELSAGYVKDRGIKLGDKIDFY